MKDMWGGLFECPKCEGRSIYIPGCVLCPGYNISFRQDTSLLHHMPTSFVTNGRYFLVTYAQSRGLDPATVVELFSGLGAKCIVARENHADGGTHLHCFADFGRKFRSRKTDIFDAGGYHANITTSRGTPEKGYDYAVKDGDIVGGDLERPSRVGGAKTHQKWLEITGASSREEFWELVHMLDPKAAATSFGQLSRYCDWKFTPVPAAYESAPLSSFIGGDVDGRDDWVSQSRIGCSEPQEGESYFPMGGAFQFWFAFPQ